MAIVPLFQMAIFINEFFSLHKRLNFNERENRKYAYFSFRVIY